MLVLHLLLNIEGPILGVVQCTCYDMDKSHIHVITFTLKHFLSLHFIQNDAVLGIWLGPGVKLTDVLIKC